MARSHHELLRVCVFREVQFLVCAVQLARERL